MAEESAITPKTITELRQVTPEEIACISEGVLETDKVMTHTTEELEHLSACLHNLSITKDKYDEISGKVKKQMRTIVTQL